MKKEARGGGSADNGFARSHSYKDAFSIHPRAPKSINRGDISTAHTRVVGHKSHDTRAASAILSPRVSRARLRSDAPGHS